MNRKQRRAERRTRAAFERELHKVVAGDPAADPLVAAFWNDTRDALGVEVALPHPEGVEVLRRVNGGGRR